MEGAPKKGWALRRALLAAGEDRGKANLWKERLSGRDHSFLPQPFPEGVASLVSLR